MILPPIKFVALPPVWPGRKRAAGWRPKPAPFKVQAWDRIQKEMQREVAQVNGKDLTLAIDVRSPGDFRFDGGIRADARPTTSRIVVSFTRPDGRRLVFPADAYGYWQHNVWGIRLSLEALRSVDRHGVTSGDLQYEGFAQITSSSSAMTPAEAFKVIAGLSGIEEAALAYPSVFASAVKLARSKAHPDAGGSQESFQRLEEAARVLNAERSAEANTNA